MAGRDEPTITSGMPRVEPAMHPAEIEQEDYRLLAKQPRQEFEESAAASSGC